jgi:hypothetical protein
LPNQPYIAPGGQTAYRKSDGDGSDANAFIAWFREDVLRTAIGTAADAASTVGSIHAKLRKIAESNVLHRPTAAQYYAGVDGGNVSFNGTAGVQTVNTSGGNVTAFVNPANSGVDLYVQRFVLSSDQPGRYERYRGATLTGLGTAATSNNRGGHPTNAAKGKIYGQGAFTPTGGNMGMITYVGASNTSADNVDGSLILRPGEEIHWRYVPNPGVSGNSSVAVEVVWWELPART